MPKNAANAKKLKRIRQLENLLPRYKQAYYAGNPLVSDAEYDALEDELKNLDPENPVLSRVGTTPTGNIKHDPPMLSSDKTTHPQDVIDWCKNYLTVWGYKIDGFSVELDYEQGRFVNASTRGNGMEGENITSHVMYLADVPKQLKKIITCKVRGEIYMNKKDFQAHASEGDWKSPRNLAVGTIKALDLTLVQKRGLRFMSWDLLVKGKAYSVKRKIELLKELGFIPADKGLIKPKDIPGFFKSIEAKRNSFAFEMDGLVFKINDPGIQLKLGSTDHHPRWMLALKFPAGEKITILREITWQIGRSGVITPVAIIDPVNLAGAMISRATLYNADFVEKNDIAPGDKVIIIRSGDVIPKIITTRKMNGKYAVIPKECPVCEFPTKREGKFLYCTNLNCRETAIRNILHYVNVIGIDGLGENSIRLLYDQKLIRHPADLYLLWKDSLVNQLGKNGEKIYMNIQKLKTLPLDKFLVALNIPELGKSASKKIAMRAISIEAISPKLVTELFGPDRKTTIAILAGFERKPWISFFNNGVKVSTGDIKRLKNPVTMESKIAGKTIYVTGKIEGMNKEEVQILVEKFGGIWKTSVSKNLDLLVLGEDAGPKKKKDATELGVKMLSWSEFLRLMKSAS